MTSVSLESAIAALRAGDREAARAVLAQIREQQPQLVDVWLWSAAASDDNDQKQTYLEQALTIEPQHPRALAALKALGVSVDRPPVSVPVAAAEQPTAQAERRLHKNVASSGSPLAAARLAPTGVRTRRALPWTMIMVLVALVMLIPLTLWLI